MTNICCRHFYHFHSNRFEEKQNHLLKLCFTGSEKYIYVRIGELSAVLMEFRCCKNFYSTSNAHTKLWWGELMKKKSFLRSRNFFFCSTLWQINGGTRSYKDDGREEGKMKVLIKISVSCHYHSLILVFHVLTLNKYGEIFFKPERNNYFFFSVHSHFIVQPKDKFFWHFSSQTTHR
jgi:hypothetical protein